MYQGLSKQHHSAPPQIPPNPPTSPTPLGALKKKTRVPSLDWTGFFVHLMSLESDDPQTELLRAKNLRALAHSFSNVAKLIGTEIVLDRTRSVYDQKIPSIDAGGLAGGEKFIAKGIFFKFARDVHKFYGGDRFAQKAANHELTGLMALMKAKSSLPELFRSIHFPLFSHITYLGYRIIAMSLLPIGPRSLVYGSADGGVVVHQDDPRVDAAMREAGKLLNLAPHQVGRVAGKMREMAVCGDIEVHRSTLRDDQFFLCDTARVFPPVRPARGRNTCLYYMFRPEFLMRHPTPLSSDAFTGWGHHNQSHHNRLVAEASEALERGIQAYAQAISAEPPAFESQQALVLDIHLHGINLRYLAALWRHVDASPPPSSPPPPPPPSSSSPSSHKIKSMIYVELMGRVLKVELFERLRERAATVSVQTLVAAFFQQFFLSSSPPDLNPYLVKHWFTLPSDPEFPMAEHYAAHLPQIRQRFDALTQLTVLPDDGGYQLRPQVKHIYVYDFKEAYATVQLAEEKVGPAAVEMLQHGASLYRASLGVFAADAEALHNYGICVFKLGRESYLRGNLQLAEHYFQEAESAYLRCGILDSSTNPHTQVSLGTLYMYWGEASDGRYGVLFQRALDAFARALALPEFPLMPKAFIHDSSGLALKKWAQKCDDMQSLDMAGLEALVARGELVFQQAIDQAAQPAQCVSVYNNLGLLRKEHADRLAQEDPEQAQAYLARAIQAYQSGLQIEDKNIGLMLNLASAFSSRARLLADPELADTDFEHAIALYDATLERYPQEWQAPYNQGLTLLSRAQRIPPQSGGLALQMQLRALHSFLRAYGVFPSRRCLNQVVQVATNLVHTEKRADVLLLAQQVTADTAHYDGHLRARFSILIVQGAGEDVALAHSAAHQAICAGLLALLEEDGGVDPAQQTAAAALSALLHSPFEPPSAAFLVGWAFQVLQAVGKIPEIAEGIYLTWRILRLLGHTDLDILPEYLAQFDFDKLISEAYVGVPLLYEMSIFVLLCVELPGGPQRLVQFSRLIRTMFGLLGASERQLVSLGTQVLQHLAAEDHTRLADVLFSDQSGRNDLLDGLLLTWVQYPSTALGPLLADLLKEERTKQYVSPHPLFPAIHVQFVSTMPDSDLVGTFFPASLPEGPLCDEQHPTFISYFSEGGYQHGWCCDKCSASFPPQDPRWRCGPCSSDYCFDCFPKSD